MADDDLPRAALPIVAGVEVLPELGTNAHDTEEIRSNLGPAELHRFGAPGQNHFAEVNPATPWKLAARRQSSSRGRFEMSWSKPCFGLRIHTRTS